MSKRTLFTGVQVFDGLARLPGVHTVAVQAGRITAVDAGAFPPGPDDLVVDGRGGTLVPGFIDAHFHAVSATLDVPRLDTLAPSYLAVDAATHLAQALGRGFTTVRDAGGADAGLRKAIDAGLVPGPRLKVSGQALSQTGGHGDMRPGEGAPTCGCAYAGALTRVEDGADNVRRAARELLRQGADQLKLFISGGVLSPTDPLWMDQFTDEEIRAAVEEAATRRTYVMAHAHTASAAKRCARLGVRSIEHGTLIDASAAAAVAAAGAWVVPTLAVIDLLRDDSMGLPAAAREKLASLGDSAAEAVGHCLAAGVRLGFGTDLFGVLRDRQLHEFTARARLQPMAEVLASATHHGAALLGLQDEIGRVARGFRADLVLLDGDPFSDAAFFAGGASRLRGVWQDGKPVARDSTAGGKAK
jgi:imidazolonepropionase-like amidohydrolase